MFSSPQGDAFGRIKISHPAMYQALLTYVVTVMSERLSFARARLANPGKVPFDLIEVKVGSHRRFDDVYGCARD